MFYADDRVFGWIYSGQVRITIDGQQPFTASKGYLFDVPPRLAYCMENTGTEPLVFYRSTPAGQLPSYPETETPTPVKGWIYGKARITSTGGYEEPNQPYLDFNAYAAGGGKSRDFAFDGHTAAHIIRAPALTALPPSTSWGHFHENMVEAWVVLEGRLDVLITSEPLVTGEVGDVIQANNERWHRATCHPNAGVCTRLAMTPRNKEGQVHYFQIGQSPGN
jgi:mannose-6-phosphate isomerase-like protein (cupin superfamily)